MRVIAIDPGAKGGLSCISIEEHKVGATISLHSVIDMPNLDTLEGCTELMEFIRTHAPDKVILELQRCRGGNSVLSTWNHARHYGKLEACLALLSPLAVILVQPITWMHAVKQQVGDVEVQGLDSTKARTWTLARQLFPDALLVGPRGRKKDGRADAICMGWYYLTHVA